MGMTFDELGWWIKEGVAFDRAQAEALKAAQQER
jgi:hypothetical protein